MIKWSPVAEFAATEISLDDHGVTVGDGIFESMRVTKHGIFAAERHLQRMQFATNLIGIDAPPTREVKQALNAVALKLHELGIFDARVRLTVTSGSGPAGVLRGANINWFITASALQPPTAAARICSVSTIRNEYSSISGIKTLSYLENVMALNHANSAGFDEALILNTKGEIAEAATSNLLFELNGKLVTPSLISGGLRGITRELVIEKFNVTELVLTKPMLAEVSGAALLSSVRGIQHISHIDQKGISGSQQIENLIKQYQELLNSAAEYWPLI
jgi:branched-chain amino acid aminotransferase